MVRGQEDAEWGVAPSLWRAGYTEDDERNLTHRFRTRAASRYAKAPSYDDHAGWLSLAQHYGLPTRLLDWSRSPLIASYFAIKRHVPPSIDEGLCAADAAIWILDPHAFNAISTRRGGNSTLSLQNASVTPAIDSGVCAPLISSAFTGGSESLISERRPAHALAIMATETDNRMFVQQGCFTVHDPEAGRIDEQPDADFFLTKLLVPRSHVGEFAADVDACGIRLGDIFPDLENLAAELIHTFRPRSVLGRKSDVPWF